MLFLVVEMTCTYTLIDTCLCHTRLVMYPSKTLI